jgi:DNA-directed RNA polymerase subunit alpha
VGDVTDYEKLVMTIETNGTITPRDAVHQATKILMDHFALVLTAAEAEATDTTATKEGDTTQEAE